MISTEGVTRETDVKSHYIYNSKSPNSVATSDMGHSDKWKLVGFLLRCQPKVNHRTLKNTWFKSKSMPT